MSMYLSAIERAKDAFIVSMARGAVIIIPLVLILSNIFKMTGVWLAFVITEFAVTMITLTMVTVKSRIGNEAAASINFVND